MSRLGPEFWAALAASRPAGDEWRVRPPLLEVTPRLLASLAANGDRRFLVALLPNEEALEDTRSRGLSIRTLELSDESGGRGRFLAVECREAAGHELFDLIGTELATALTAQPPATAASRVVGKWRRFWGQIPRSLLSREEQLGLLAEVWFLGQWLIPAAGLASATARWRGPFGARHDFEWPGLSVEVKASTVVRGPVFRIHGLDQLDPPSAGGLYLYTLRLREEAGATHTLPNVIADCQTLLAPDPDALARYETALAQAGYSPAHEVDYAQARWRIVDEKLYPVVTGFPRLSPSALPNGVPPGVEEISYSLDLASYAGTRFTEPLSCSPALR